MRTQHGDRAVYVSVHGEHGIGTCATIYATLDAIAFDLVVFTLPDPSL